MLVRSIARPGSLHASLFFLLATAPFAAALGSSSCAAAGVVLGEGGASSTSSTHGSTTTTTSTTTTSSTTSSGTGGSAMTGSGGAGGSTTTTGAGGSTTTTGSVGNGGASGSTTTTGAGGNGGASATTGAGGSGGAGATTGAGGGGGAGGAAPSGTVLLVAGGGAAMVGGEYHPGMGWMSTAIAEATSDGPGVAFTGAGSALIALRSKANGGALRVGTWAPGAFSAFAALGPAVTTRATPSLIGGVGEASLVFHGDDFKHYFALHGAAWNPIAEPVGGAAAQSFGPSPASLVALGADRIAFFAGGNGDLYDQPRTAGAWQAAHGHGLGDVVALTPSVVAEGAGGIELLVVFVRKTDAKIAFTTRAAGVWAAPSLLDASSFTADPVALTATPTGAVAAFRGLDGKVYTSRFTPGAMPPWSLPAPLVQPNPAVASAPSLAPGVGGAEAELAYANSADGVAYHTRLGAQGWSAPVGVGGAGVTRVAIASAP